VALRQPNLRVVTVEDHVAVLRMLAKRHKQLASLKTQAAARLHAGDIAKSCGLGRCG